MGSSSPWEGAILREKGWPIITYRDSAVSCAKTAEPIEIPFGIGLGWVQTKHVLDEVQISLFQLHISVFKVQISISNTLDAICYRYLQLNYRYL